jgi:hypothetical protein
MYVSRTVAEEVSRKLEMVGGWVKGEQSWG